MKLIKELSISGVFEFSLNTHIDNRGSFIKYYFDPIFKDLGIYFDMKECYLSSSKKGTIRGMHLQDSPFELQKVVTCVNGSVLDVLLDLRPDSKSYLKYETIELSTKMQNALFIPEGIAHGFQSKVNNTNMLYLTNCIQNKEAEIGIKWDSFGFCWPYKLEHISERDVNLPTLDSYLNSCF